MAPPPSLHSELTLPSFPPTSSLTANVLQGWPGQCKPRQGCSSAGKIQFLCQWLLTGRHIDSFIGLLRKWGEVHLSLQIKEKSTELQSWSQPIGWNSLWWAEQTQRRDLYTEMLCLSVLTFPLLHAGNCVWLSYSVLSKSACIVFLKISTKYLQVS